MKINLDLNLGGGQIRIRWHLQSNGDHPCCGHLLRGLCYLPLIRLLGFLQGFRVTRHARKIFKSPGSRWTLVVLRIIQLFHSCYPLETRTVNVAHKQPIEWINYLPALPGNRICTSCVSCQLLLFITTNGSYVRGLEGDFICEGSPKSIYPFA